ncbi:hypothetical protein THAOC_28816, partial [Thalassiosira oceanica]
MSRHDKRDQANEVAAATLKVLKGAKSDDNVNLGKHLEEDRVDRQLEGAEHSECTGEEAEGDEDDDSDEALQAFVDS